MIIDICLKCKNFQRGNYEKDLFKQTVSSHSRVKAEQWKMESSDSAV